MTYEMIEGLMEVARSGRATTQAVGDRLQIMGLITPTQGAFKWRTLTRQGRETVSLLRQFWSQRRY